MINDYGFVPLKVKQQFLQFVNKPRPALISEDELLHPLIFWQSDYKYPDLRIMAQDLFRLPCSAAGSERFFKSMHHVHDKKRTRMSTHDVEMRASIQYNRQHLARDRNDLFKDRSASFINMFLTSGFFIDHFRV